MLIKSVNNEDNMVRVIISKKKENLKNSRRYSIKVKVTIEISKKVNLSGDNLSLILIVWYS